MGSDVYSLALCPHIFQPLPYSFDFPFYLAKAYLSWFSVLNEFHLSSYPIYSPPFPTLPASQEAALQGLPS